MLHVSEIISFSNQSNESAVLHVPYTLSEILLHIIYRKRLNFWNETQKFSNKLVAARVRSSVCSYSENNSIKMILWFCTHVMIHSHLFIAMLKHYMFFFETAKLYRLVPHQSVPFGPNLSDIRVTRFYMYFTVRVLNLTCESGSV